MMIDKKHILNKILIIMNRYLIIKEIKENLYRQRQKIKINN
jgi:hypothetical protein